MKAIISLILWCILLPLFTVANAKVQPSLSVLSGTYEGRVFNGDNMDPVLTTFFIDESGQVLGKYAMGEETGLEVGVLTNLRMEGDYTFVFDWKDRYGTGILRILFSSDYKVFYGLWGKTQSDTLLPWNGIKR
jgi:hypothetical protein